MSQPLSGVIAAVATPIDESGAPDLKRAINLARYLLDNGCDGLNVLGTTGEATSFSLDERKAVMDAYKSNGLPLHRLMVGTGAAAISDAVAFTRHAAELGFGGALVLPPFYYKGVPDDGLVAYIETLVKTTERKPIPIYLYHFPAMSGLPWHVALIRRLLELFLVPHCGFEGFLRRHGLCPLSGSHLQEFRRISVNRSMPDRGAFGRFRRLHLSDRQSQPGPLRASLEPRRYRCARRRSCDPQTFRWQAAGLRREGIACSYP